MPSASDAPGSDPSVSRADSRSKPWYWHAAWTVATAVLAFAVTSFFSGVLHLPRRLFVVPHALFTCGLAWAYLRASGVGVLALLRRKWRVGLVGAAVVSIASLNAALGVPASAHATGWRLWFDLAWSGVFYGMLDATLLTIMPVLTISRAFSAAGLTSRRLDRVGMRVAAFLGSAVVTVLFHLGFPEYRLPDIGGAVFGNSVLTLGYLFTTSPLTPLLSHALLHAIAVYHSPALTPLLPPHL